MPITIEKIEEAQEKLSKVQRKALELDEVLVLASDEVLQNNEGGTIIAFTEAQKTALLAEYNSRKTALQTAVNELL